MMAAMLLAACSTEEELPQIETGRASPCMRK